MGYRSTLVRATKTDPPYVTDELLAGLGDRPDFTLLDSTATTWFRRRGLADTAAVIRKQLERG